MMIFSRQIRAGPVIGPERRIDSNIAARSADQGLFEDGWDELGKTWRLDGSKEARVVVRLD